jgi:hypothetical protein
MTDVNKADLRADWLEHPYAGIARKRAEDMRGVALSTLRGACSQSTDPKVRAAYEKLNNVEQFIDLLTKGVP